MKKGITKKTFAIIIGIYALGWIVYLFILKIASSI